MKIGITGHQNLVDKPTISWLKNELLEEIQNMQIEEAYSSLAIGADQLFAEIILTIHIPLVAIIPCINYEFTFDKNNIKIYKAILNKSSNKIQLDFNSPSEQAFYEAGKLVANKSDIVFALWNNLPSEGLGGTADIVDYAKKLNKKIIHLNPISKTKNFINYG